MAKFQNSVLKPHTELATVTGLLKYDKFGSYFVLLKTKIFSYSIVQKMADLSLVA